MKERIVMGKAVLDASVPRKSINILVWKLKARANTNGNVHYGKHNISHLPDEREIDTQTDREW